MIKKILFLFGAGISVEAGFPTGNDITQGLLSSDFENIISKSNNWDHTNYRHEKMCFDQIQNGLLIAKLYLDLTLKKTVNYEDIYNLSNDSSLIGKTNLFTQFFDYCHNNISKILVNNTDKEGFVKRSDLYLNACIYIQKYIWYKLTGKIGNIFYLKNIADICLDSKIQEINIFTLNHDLVIEKLLNCAGINYIDGFEQQNNIDVRYWNPEIYKNDSKVRLFKLHGSANWFDFENENDPSKTNRLGIPNIKDFYHTKDETGNPQWPAGGIPFFLTGTDNKILEYENNKYINLLIEQFKNKISDFDILVTSGYGFGDEGINKILIEWLEKSVNRRIVNINKSEPSVIFNSRIITTGKYIQNTTYEEILKLLGE